MRLRLLRAIALLVLALAPVAAASPAGAAITREASTSVWYVNGSRAAARAPALRASTGGLSTLAWQHSCAMARSGRLYHNPTLAQSVTGWHVLGENVGVGPSIHEIHKAFMASPGHRANVLGRSYHTIGAGVCRDAAGRYWVTHIFFG